MRRREFLDRTGLAGDAQDPDREFLDRVRRLAAEAGPNEVILANALGMEIITRNSMDGVLAFHYGSLEGKGPQAMLVRLWPRQAQCFHEYQHIADHPIRWSPRYETA